MTDPVHVQALTPFLAAAMEQVKNQRTGRCLCGDCTIGAIELAAWRMYWATLPPTFDLDEWRERCDASIARLAAIFAMSRS